MQKKTNYSYIGISFIILVFGIYFIPKIIDRISNNDTVRNDGGTKININPKGKVSDLSFIEINGEKKRVPSFSFVNQDGKLITNKDYDG